MITCRFRFRGAQCHQKKRLRAVSCRSSASSDLTPHFTLLGLTPLASKSDVKQAYRRLALRYHPDVYKTQDCLVKEKAFREIKSAYEVRLIMDNNPTLKLLGLFQNVLCSSFQKYSTWEDEQSNPLVVICCLRLGDCCGPASVYWHELVFCGVHF